MVRTHGAPLRPLLAVLLVAALLIAPFTQVQHASAADGTLVLAAIRVLQEDYVDQVQSVPLLNAAIVVLRKAVNLGADALPEIPASTSASDAAAQFTADFSKAAQTGT